MSEHQHEQPPARLTGKERPRCEICGRPGHFYQEQDVATGSLHIHAFCHEHGAGLTPVALPEHLE